MISNDETLEPIRQKEKSKLWFKGKLTSTYIVNTRTKAVSDLYRVQPGTDSKTFRPSPVKTAMLFLVVCMLLFFLIQLQKIRSKPTPAYVMAVVMVVTIPVVIYHVHFNPKKNYSIHLDFGGMMIGKEFHRWSDIKETGILRIGSGRGRRFYLIVALKDGTYSRNNLFGFLTFWGFQSALSTYIEFFKSPDGKAKSRS